MQISELEKFLQHQIPLVNSLGVTVVQANDELVELKAPLDSNRNHLGTAFGGSTYSLAVLACYTWLFNFLENKQIHCHVVIKNGQMRYTSPVGYDFTAVCSAPSAEDLNNFLIVLRRKKKGQIVLQSEIKTKSGISGLFEGEFVVNSSAR